MYNEDSYCTYFVELEWTLKGDFNEESRIW